MTDLIGVIIGLLLTLFIYSYLFGDNPLYRLAVHILVGVSAAYAAVVIVDQVIFPIYRQAAADPASPASLAWLIPTGLALLLIIKRLPATWLGNSPAAYLVGIGAAVALLGAIQGTLIPQVFGGGERAASWQGVVTALFTAVTLFAFQFTRQRKPDEDADWSPSIWMRGAVYIGRTVLMITFGALFAAVLATSLALFVDRIAFFVDQFAQLLS